jgi:hypothetical protein
MDWELIGIVLDCLPGPRTPKQSPAARAAAMAFVCIGLGMLGVVFGICTWREDARVFGIMQIGAGAVLLATEGLLIPRWRRLRRKERSLRPSTDCVKKTA